MEGFKRGLKRSSGYYPKIQFDAFLVAVKVTKSRARKFLDLSTVRRKGWKEVFFHPISIFTLSSLCSLIRQLISRWQPLVTATPFQSRVRPFLLSVTGCQRNTFPSEHSSIIEFAHFDINEITFNKIFESWAQYMTQVRRKTNSLSNIFSSWWNSQGASRKMERRKKIQRTKTRRREWRREARKRDEARKGNLRAVLPWKG